MFNLYATASFSWKYMYTMKIKQAKAVNFQSKVNCIFLWLQGVKFTNVDCLS